MKKNTISFLPDFSIRYTGPELMDNLGESSQSLFKTLDDFCLINRYLSKSQTILKKYVFKDLAFRKQKEVTLLDVGSGGGDIARWFVLYARRLGIKATVYCLDHDQRCIDYSRKKCEHYPEVHFLKMSVDELDSIAFTPDYIFSNHLLHHLEEAEILLILTLFNSIANRGFIVNDLRRSALSYAVFSFLKPLFGNSSFTWRDGLLSIRKSFKKGEIEQLIESAQLSATVRCMALPPGRIVITNL